MRIATLAVCCLLGLSVAHAQSAGATPGAQPHRTPPPPPPPLVPNLPTLFVVGDSTAANNNNPKQVGWGIPFAALFDPAKINIANRARGGRSSRTFITEGLWDKVLAEMKPGDIVLLQFGHNDAGPVNDNFRARGSVKGLGEETEEIDNLITKKHEIIHTFGWYMRKMIADTKAKGATPIVLGLTVRDNWKDGTVERGPGNYTALSRQIAHDAGVKFMDLTSLIASRYEQLGQAAVKPYFPGDSTHTNIEGATINAGLVLAGLKQFSDLHWDDYLSDQGRAVPVAAAPVTAP